MGRLLGIQHASSNLSTCSATLLPTSDCAPRILAPLVFPPPWLLSARAIHRPEGGPAFCTRVARTRQRSVGPRSGVHLTDPPSPQDPGPTLRPDCVGTSWTRTCRPTPAPKSFAPQPIPPQTRARAEPHRPSSAPEATILSRWPPGLADGIDRATTSRLDQSEPAGQGFDSESSSDSSQFERSSTRSAEGGCVER